MVQTMTVAVAVAVAEEVVAVAGEASGGRGGGRLGRGASWADHQGRRRRLCGVVRLEGGLDGGEGGLQAREGRGEGGAREGVGESPFGSAVWEFLFLKIFYCVNLFD